MENVLAGWVLRQYHFHLWFHVRALRLLPLAATFLRVLATDDNIDELRHLHLIIAILVKHLEEFFGPLLRQRDPVHPETTTELRQSDPLFGGACFGSKLDPAPNQIALATAFDALRDGRP